jgi:hypothetical protein
MRYTSPTHAACEAHVADLHRSGAQRRLAGERNAARPWRERVLDLVRPFRGAARSGQSLVLATRPAPHH